MITEVQLDSLIRAIEEKRVVLEQVPVELRERVSKVMHADNEDK